MSVFEALPVAIALAIVIVVVALSVMLLVLLWGMHIGQQLAVDQTRSQGSFPAYGKRWVAIELEPVQRGHVPPRAMRPPAPPSTIRPESDVPARPQS